MENEDEESEKKNSENNFSNSKEEGSNGNIIKIKDEHKEEKKEDEYFKDEIRQNFDNTCDDSKYIKNFTIQTGYKKGDNTMNELIDELNTNKNIKKQENIILDDEINIRGEITSYGKNDNINIQNQFAKDEKKINDQIDVLLKNSENYTNIHNKNIGGDKNYNSLNSEKKKKKN